MPLNNKPSSSTAGKVAHIKKWLGKSNYRTTKSKLFSRTRKTWLETMASKDTKALSIFERRILRKMYGPIKERDEYKTRTNREIEDIIDTEDIVRYVKALRITWL